MLAVQVAVAQSYGRVPSVPYAQAGAVTGRPGAVMASAVFNVVVLRAGSRSRQVTSPAADVPIGRLARPPAVTVVADMPAGSSCRTVVSIMLFPALRTSIR
ncbi:hypothetical protein GCM10023176_45310 [Micromonospora coerulea]|uniref:Uncharacterized protein n=1 Tax=Micromonospora coerulea TaxID=47856 RepID=A0ABP8SVN5_9ACTN